MNLRDEVANLQSPQCTLLHVDRGCGDRALLLECNMGDGQQNLQLMGALYMGNKPLLHMDRALGQHLGGRPANSYEAPVASPT